MLLRTKNAQAASFGPQAYGSAPASDVAVQGSSLADAKPLTDDGTDVSDFHQIGRASWYGRGFHGRRTANGERYDMHALTAAHRTLPLGSYVADKSRHVAFGRRAESTTAVLMRAAG